MRNDHDPETATIDFIDGEGNSLQRDRPFRGNQVGQIRRGINHHPVTITITGDINNLTQAVNMAGDDMPAQLIPHGKGAFEVDFGANLPGVEGRHGNGFERNINRKSLALSLNQRQAATAACY